MRPVLRLAALALLGTVCAYALYAWAYAPCSCLLKVQSIGGTTLDAEAAAAYQAPIEARTNLARLEKLEKRCKTEIRVYMLKAKNQRMLGRNDEALRTYQRALEIEPRPEVYYAQGMLLAEIGRLDEAVDAFVPAVRAFPTMIDGIATYSGELARQVTDRVARNAATDS